MKCYGLRKQKNNSAYNSGTYNSNVKSDIFHDIQISESQIQTVLFIDGY